MKRIFVLAIMLILVLATFSQVQAATYVGQICTIKASRPILGAPSGNHQGSILLYVQLPIGMVVIGEQLTTETRGFVQVERSVNGAIISGWVRTQDCTFAQPRPPRW